MPPHWHVETANSIIVAERRKRITTDEVRLTFDDIRAFRVTVDRDGLARTWGVTVTLAQAHGLTVYDTVYLELAIRRGLPLASLDKRLIAAAGVSGVEVLTG